MSPFTRTERQVALPEASQERPVFQPSCNIYETSDEVVLEASMPGTSADALDIELTPGELTVRARVEHTPPPDAKVLLREHAVGDYFRRFQVSESLDIDAAQAEYARGVLTLRMPKLERARPRRIPVIAS